MRGRAPAKASFTWGVNIYKGEREREEVVYEEAGRSRGEKGWSVGSKEGRSRGEGKNAVSARKKDGEGKDAASARKKDGRERMQCQQGRRNPG